MFTRRIQINHHQTIHIMMLQVLAFYLTALSAVEVQVGQEVIAPAGELEPLGVNAFGDIGGLDESSGNLIHQSGFEMIHMRNLYRVLDCGKEKGFYWITLDGPSTSDHLRYYTGMYSGAALRAYRFVDEQGIALPIEENGHVQGGKIINMAGLDHVVKLFETTVVPKGHKTFPRGGWIADTPGINGYDKWEEIGEEGQERIAKQWRVYYQGKIPLRTDDLVIFSKTEAWPQLEDYHPRVRGEGVKSTWQTFKGSMKHIRTPKNVPVSVQAETGIAELTPENGVVDIWHKMFGNPNRDDAFFYTTLDEGQRYHYEVWAKVDDGGSGRLHLGFGEHYEGAWEHGYFGHKLGQTFDVNDKWTKYAFTFTGPKAPNSGGIEGAFIHYEGENKLYIDNVKMFPIYSNADVHKPFVIQKTLFNELMSTQPKEGKKGALRSWNMMSPASMDALLRWTNASSVDHEGHVQVISLDPQAQGTTTPKALTIMEATGDTAQTRMVPWLITQVTHDELEYMQLIEYLAAPYDPKLDTPTSKPFAFRRTQHRGHNRPWIEDFREVIIEIGNENWHNRQMEGWIGVGRYGQIHRGGAEMGVWNKYLVQHMRKSPYWDSDKIKICVGGNYYYGIDDGPDWARGFGQEAVLKSEDTADYHSHATYIGPRWETGESSQKQINDAGVQKTLLSYRSAIELEWEGQEKAHIQLQEMGFHAKMSAYEGGPSGFGLWAETAEEERAGEYYGKSLAMGTAVLDSWLDAWQKGWGYQCYLTYGQGKWWNSHTSKAHGFRPSPGFLITGIVNQTMANRDKLSVQVVGAPSMRVRVEVEDKMRERDVQLLQAHAFGDTAYLAVAISNLSLTQHQEVQLRVPFKKAKRIVAYSLTGDPRDTNLDDYMVRLLSKQIETTELVDGLMKFTVPAGMPLVLCFEK